METEEQVFIGKTVLREEQIEPFGDERVFSPADRARKEHP